MEGINSTSFTLLSPYLLTAAILIIVVLLRWIYCGNNSTNRKPPGPRGWPLVGYIFHLGTAPHQKFYQLGQKYGPVLWLRLGLIDTLVVQSAKAAGELFKKHDLAVSERMVHHALTAFDYNQASLAIGIYGPYWRMLRKLCNKELFDNKRVRESTEIREKCVEKMVKSVEENEAFSHAQGKSGEIELAQLFFIMVFNMVGNLMLSRDLIDLNSNESREFHNAMNNFMKGSGEPNIADFLPFLKWLDPARVKRNMVKDMGVAIDIVTRFLIERSQETTPTEKVNKDFLDFLLHYENHGKEGPEKFSEKNITLIIMEMFLAASENTGSAIEWAMAELLRNPESMKKVKEELDSSIPITSKSIKESDIDKLPYLCAVVKEALRLHPPGPLLPRKAIEDTNFMGYFIPKGTMVHVNVWAIGRDPDVWEDPLSFKPERFLGSNIDFKGRHYELLPFGSGRRICAGMALGERMVHLSLANLFWTFDWELGKSVTPANLDMTERTGLTSRMMNPLKAIPKRRRSNSP